MDNDELDQHTTRLGPSYSATDARDAALSSIEARNLANELAAGEALETALKTTLSCWTRLRCARGSRN